MTPSIDQYVIGSPLFDKAVLKLENGKEFVITAKNNSAQNCYIQSAGLNGKSYNQSYIRYKDIQNGGELVFNLDKNPNINWASKPENAPYSLSNEN